MRDELLGILEGIRAALFAILFFVAVIAGLVLSTFLSRPAHSATLAGVHQPVAAKARQIVVMCDARILSGVRHTFIAGTHHLSQHAGGWAVDITADDPACIYRQLAGWPGGYTTDFKRVRHVHFSYGGPEQGLRFKHGSGKKRRHSYTQHAHASQRTMW